MITDFINFKAGYAVDLPPERFEEGMCQTAENCWWVDAPVKRQGHSQYADLTTWSNCRGFIREKINSNWTTILALDMDSNVQFFQGTSNTYSVIDSAYSFDVGYEVEFASLAGTDTVLAVNGQNRPLVVYYSGAFLMQELEEYDVRVRNSNDWSAGAWDDSASTYTDDSDDARSSTADDFQLVAALSNDDGFIVACDFRFTELVCKSTDQFTGVVAAAYQYYSEDSAWSNLTMELTPTWSNATGDRTLEWTLPTNWMAYDGTEDNLQNRYAVRVKFTTAPTNTPTCDYFTVKHTQYFRDISIDGKPQAVATHQNSYWLAVDNYIFWSAPNVATGWELRRADYCLEGGSKILRMITHNEYLAIFKEQAIYGFFGNQFGEAVRKKLDDMGTISGRSVAVVGPALYYLGNDGFVRGWNGLESQRLSGHIQSDIDGYTQTDAIGVTYKGWYFLSFPTNQIFLLFDPDTYRTADYGDGRVSFFKWKNCEAKMLAVFSGQGESRALIGYDGTTKKLLTFQDGNYGDNTNSAIDMQLETAPISYKAFQQMKRHRRAKVDLNKAGDWTVTFKADHGTATSAHTVSSGTGAGHYEEDMSLPYTLDGKNFSVLFRNNTTNMAKIYGFAIESERRRF